MNSARLDALGEAETGPQVLGEDGSGQSVLGVVGDAQGLLLGLDLDQAHRRAERLGLVDVHLGRDLGDDNGPHAGLGRLGGVEVAGEDRGALAHGVVEQLLDLVDGAAVDKHGRVAAGGEDGLDGGGELLLELGADLLVHQDPLGAHADLAREQEGAQDALLGGEVQVGVLPDDGGGLAAQLEHDGLQVLAAQAADDAADGGAAGEVDLADGRVLNQGAGELRGVGGVGGQEVDDTVGEAGLLEAAGDGPENDGGELRALEDGRVSSGDGLQDGTDAENVGGIPGSDGQYHTERLLQDHGVQVGVAQLRDGTIDAADPAGNILDDIDGSVDVQVGPVLCAAGANVDVFGKLSATLLHDVGGLQQQIPARGRGGVAPCREGPAGSIDGRVGMLLGGDATLVDKLSRRGRDDIEGGRGPDLLAIDDERYHVVGHICGAFLFCGG